MRRPPCYGHSSPYPPVVAVHCVRTLMSFQSNSLSSLPNLGVCRQTPIPRYLTAFYLLKLLISKRLGLHLKPHYIPLPSLAQNCMKSLFCIRIPLRVISRFFFVGSLDEWGLVMEQWESWQKQPSSTVSLSQLSSDFSIKTYNVSWRSIYR